MIAEIIPNARAILDDLIDEIDNAGAVLMAEKDCTAQRGKICGFRDFNIAVAKASGRAKRMLLALGGAPHEEM